MESCAFFTRCPSGAGLRLPFRKGLPTDLGHDHAPYEHVWASRPLSFDCRWEAYAACRQRHAEERRALRVDAAVRRQFRFPRGILNGDRAGLIVWSLFFQKPVLPHPRLHAAALNDNFVFLSREDNTVRSGIEYRNSMISILYHTIFCRLLQYGFNYFLKKQFFFSIVCRELYWILPMLSKGQILQRSLPTTASTLMHPTLRFRLSMLVAR